MVGRDDPPYQKSGGFHIRYFGAPAVNPVLTLSRFPRPKPNYRRARVPGATYFFTVVLAERGGRLLVENIALLREAFRATRRDHPFRIDAMVVRSRASPLAAYPLSSVDAGMATPGTKREFGGATF